MAAFVSASSQRITADTTPVTAPPFTVAAWVRPTALTTGPVWWSLNASGSTSNYFTGYISTGGLWGMSINAGSSEVTVEVGATTTGAWHFILLRFITATNRRIALLQSNGQVVHGNSTTSRVPSNINRQSIGAWYGPTPSGHMDGDIAEWWWAAADFWDSAAAIPDGVLRALAYGGPFSSPAIERAMLEYRALRTCRGSDTDKVGEVVYGRAGRPTWTNTNGATVGPVPPLPPTYFRIGTMPRVMPV